MSEVVLRASQVACSEDLGDFIDRKPDLKNVVINFLDPTKPYSETIRGLEFVAAGATSAVYKLGDTAIKISTGTEGILDSGRPSYAAPADLILEHRFMNVLGKVYSPNAGITVPEQYFAAQRLHGGYISMHEYIAGRVTLETWLRTNDIDPGSPEAGKILNILRERVRGQLVGKKASGMINLATRDATRTGNGAGANILVEPVAFSPVNGEIVVIDQPDGGAISTLAARFAVARYAKELQS